LQHVDTRTDTHVEEEGTLRERVLYVVDERGGMKSRVGVRGIEIKGGGGNWEVEVWTL